MEVINGGGIHLKRLDWCAYRNLSFMGVTDAHGIISYTGDYRPGMIPVVAPGNFPEATREAFDAHRTMAWRGKYSVGYDEISTYIRRNKHLSVNLKLE